MDDTSRRQRWLQKRFQAIISGDSPISPGNAKQFLEAISQNPKPCFTAVMTNSVGVPALLNALKYDLSTPFFNTYIQPFVQSLQDKDFSDTNNGALFSDLLNKLTSRDMDLFWMELRKAFLGGDLDENTILALGWLHLKICLSSNFSHHEKEFSSVVARLTSSSNLDIQRVGNDIQSILTILQFSVLTDGVSFNSLPGGRHDNDHSDFRKISILPTQDEMQCPIVPSLRHSSFLDDPETEHNRVGLHLDNQFRLLREDMLSEMKVEFQVATGKKKGYQRGVKIKLLALKELYCGVEKRRENWGLVCTFDGDSFPGLSSKSKKEREAYWTERPNFLKHRSLACLMSGAEIVGFASINRDENRLAKVSPEVVLQIEDTDSIKKALLNFKLQSEVTLIQINTAVFAFEPILKGLQRTRTLALSDELLLWKKDDVLDQVEIQALPVLDALLSSPTTNLGPLLGIQKDIVLDSSQATSLICGLTNKVSLIQGPPGTGKSFIGALIAKSIHDFTELTILVVCYTNHALDDILESLLDIGIPESSMVRMGAKSTARTQPLSIRAQDACGGRSQEEWGYINELESHVEKLHTTLDIMVQRFVSSSIQSKDILAYLEFCDEDLEFFNVFQVPSSGDGFHLMGSDGKEIDSVFLLERWAKGRDAGVLKNSKLSRSETWKAVWEIPFKTRNEYMQRWEVALLKDDIDEIYQTACTYNRYRENMLNARGSRTTAVLRSKRVVGCTTTAAAKYRQEIQAFNPNVLLVEEAGEILESHVLMSLGPETSQVILIGDHKQLRPKVKNYNLTVEKGDGFDLNRSLFERLILRGYPHRTLSQQHRMRPEISALIRRLTYPQLVDAPRTQGRPDIRGVRDNVIFINHDHPEDEFKQIADRLDMSSTTSKQNSYEAQMILKIVRYLGQQGYGTKELVILTPYLGQLQALREILKKDNDPILNDLDSFELIQAGLMLSSDVNRLKNPIRLSTIDNYQGEESDIVITSLTRGNPRHDIGFMYAPERLNVLLSRARNGLIMLGNANTFLNARKGKELWRDLYEMLKHDNHVYNGLPVKCEQHPDITAVLSNPSEFDEHCPDGGCSIPCGTKFTCGSHSCQMRCHKLKVHSKVRCEASMPYKCLVAGHSLSYKCYEGPPRTCQHCEREKRLARDRQRKIAEEQQKRDEEQRAHHAAMDKLNADIEQERRRQRDAIARTEKNQAIQQKQQDLENLKNQTSVLHTPPTASSLSQLANSRQTSSVHVVNQPLFPPNPALPPSNPIQSNKLDANSNTSPPSAPVPPPTSSPNPASPGFLSKLRSTMPSLSMASATSNSSSTKPQLPPKPFRKLDPSPSKQDWNNQKLNQGATNAAIDAIMEMTGLEEVKKQILNILTKVEVANRQNVSLKRERFHVSFLGNPGTGKTTVARQYAKFLASIQAVPGDTFEEVTGASLANKGVNAAEKLLNSVTATGGVIFVDEAYQLTSGINPGGAAVLDYLLAEMENRVGKVVFIFAGYSKEMEKFFDHNPGLKSRVPYEFHFTDYKDEELMAMFNGMIDKTFGGRMKVEDGVEGLYGRIVIRRLGRKRGCPGFGNARDLENIFSKIRERQAARLKTERKWGIRPDDLWLTAGDMIGPEPSVAILQSEAYDKLKKMIGLRAVKDAVANVITISSENYNRELSEKEPISITLNQVFLGSPGTGKTTVAKLYGQILSDVGLLSNGEVILKNPSDFVGAVIGASEANTKAILANSTGKVLIIDEAYMLYGGGGKGANAGQSNQFKTSVIDTIVAEVQNTPGEDRCVLLLGYKDQMIEMFQNVNPGLSRRFKIEDAFNFEDFTDDELLSILDKKLKEQDLSATDEAKKVAIERLARMRNRPNFGNAGEVENLITQAKTRALQRRSKMSAPELTNQIDITFVQEDFDPDCNREQNAAENLTKLFEDVVGHESIIQRLKDYQQIARTCKARNLEPRDQVPMNFIFTGPPGTGKTTIARKVGQVFYDMGLLSAAEVVECSASDLVGQYVGHTGPKTKALFEKALGKVLFVDEAYRLSKGHFAQEAIDEVVGLLTHPSFKGKLVIVLAGYEEDMKNLMSVNTGLASRFPHQVVFPNMSVEECMKVILNELKKKGVEIDDWEDESSDFAVNMKELIRDLKKLPDWGNARDMVTLAKEMVSIALLDSNNGGAQTQSGLRLPSNGAMNVAKKMIEERQRRAKLPRKREVNDLLPVQSKDRSTRPTPVGAGTSQARSPTTPTNSGPSSSPANNGSQSRVVNIRGRNHEPRRRNGRHPSNRTADSASPGPSQVASPHSHGNEGQGVSAGRDPGVTDAIWCELAIAKQKALARDKREKQELQALKDKLRRAAQEEKERALKELRAKESAERQRKAKEERVQRRLREMGVCRAGFQWINMGNHYRCAGGSHTVSLDQLGNV